MEQLLNADDGDYQGSVYTSPSGCTGHFQGYRNKKVETMMGEVTIKRNDYYDEQNKKKGFVQRIRSWILMTVRLFLHCVD